MLFGSQVLPYIVYCAECKLRAGAELDVSWGDLCWQVRPAVPQRPSG